MQVNSTNVQFEVCHIFNFISNSAREKCVLAWLEYKIEHFFGLFYGINGTWATKCSTWVGSLTTLRASPTNSLNTIYSLFYIANA